MKRKVSREELLLLTKDDLVDKIVQLEAHNVQLKNIISKSIIQNQDEAELSKRKPFNFSKCHFRRILLRVMYFGWDYQGLAVQEDTSKTIEHSVFKALTKACLIQSRETSQYHRCGRTDKGVSSFGQVISICLRSKFPPEDQHLPDSVRDEIPYCKILNRLLPQEIRMVSWMPVPIDKPEYSARFDCKSRKYKYYFPRSNLNILAMNEACKRLVGSHDFRNLCKMDVGNGVTEFVRNIVAAEVLPVDKNAEDDGTAMYCLHIEGNAFLWHQIRCIFGILLLIGQGKETPIIINDLLDVKKHPRKPQYCMALDVPLNLFECRYDLEQGQSWVYDRRDFKVIIEDLQSYWTIHGIKSAMIKDCVTKLEDVYTGLGARRNDEKEDVVESDGIMSHAECLLQGVKPRKYKPLLERDTCESLEERIEHYRKKRKVEPVEYADDHMQS